MTTTVIVIVVAAVLALVLDLRGEPEEEDAVAPQPAATGPPPKWLLIAATPIKFLWSLLWHVIGLVVSLAVLALLIGLPVILWGWSLEGGILHQPISLWILIKFGALILVSGLCFSLAYGCGFALRAIARSLVELLTGRGGDGTLGSR